jgi:adenylosuccinate synthase
MTIAYADVIIGTQYGDEGKGKISHSLCKDSGYTHVIRFSGSNNAGHTVYHNGKKVVTHSIPIGVLHGVKSIIGPGCVLNVEHFFNELKELEDAGVKTAGLVYVASNAHVITDAHLQEDRQDNAIGTTRRGNGPAYGDKYRRKGIRAADVPELQPYLIDIFEELYCEKTQHAKILFEGAQGFGLDIDWGDYPYVTSGHCTVGGAVLNGVPPKSIRDIWGVAKIYETYVGAKKFEPNEPIFSKMRELAGEYGATTGRPRQCNWLDMRHLKKSIIVNGINKLVFNKMDILRELGEWKLYDTEGQLLSFNSESEMKIWIYAALIEHVREIHWSDNPNGF